MLENMANDCEPKYQAQIITSQTQCTSVRAACQPQLSLLNICWWFYNSSGRTPAPTLTMTRSGCSQTGSLAAAASWLDRPAGFHGNRWSSSVVAGPAATQEARLSSVPNCKTTFCNVSQFSWWDEYFSAPTEWQETKSMLVSSVLHRTQHIPCRVISETGLYRQSTALLLKIASLGIILSFAGTAYSMANQA